MALQIPKMYSVFSPMFVNMTGQSSVSLKTVRYVHVQGAYSWASYHPFPILQPTTPQAFPLARTSSGKISAG